MSIDESPATKRPARAPGDERWYLTDERDFLQRSLADAEREREAGDLSEEDHAVLVARDHARLAEVERDLAALDAETGADTGSGAAAGAGSDLAESPDVDGADPAQPERPPMALWRRLGIVAACLLDRGRRGATGRALRPGPPTRAGLIGQRHGVAGAAH